MSLNNVFDISSSAMTAQSMRLNTIASNMANADSITSSTGQPYRPKQVVFSAIPLDGKSAANGAAKVRVTEVVEDSRPPRKVYDPKNPFADSQGYVSMPNVNPIEEMVNMISASRAYQMNVDMMNTAKSMLLKTLSLGA